MKIGLLGGTFDPIHNGHLAIADSALRQHNLDELWFMPSPDPPHKLDVKKSDFTDRFEMTKLGVAEYVDKVMKTEGLNITTTFKVSDYETKLPQPSYSAKTLANLHFDYPKDEFYFIIGEDSLDQIETWFEPASVLAQAVILVYGRFEEEDARSIDEQIKYLTGKYEGANIRTISGEWVNVSSTEIRKKVSQGDSIKNLVPEKVEEYICQTKLYQEKNCMK